MSHPLYGDWLEPLVEASRRGDETTARAFTDWLVENNMPAHAEIIKQNLDVNHYSSGYHTDGPKYITSSVYRPTPNWLSLSLPTAKGYLWFGSRHLHPEAADKLEKALKEETGQTTE